MSKNLGCKLIDSKLKWHSFTVLIINNSSPLPWQGLCSVKAPDWVLLQHCVGKLYLVMVVYHFRDTALQYFSYAPIPNNFVTLFEQALCVVNMQII